MEIDVRKNGEVCVLGISGRLTYPEATAALREKARELIAGGERNLVLNLLRVPFLDSSGIGEVVACYKRARQQGGEVKLVLDKKPRQVFTYCHLEKMFEMYTHEPDALASFR